MRLQVRTDKPTALHLEICAKHLLYDGGCQLKALQVPAKAGEWQTLQAQLEGDVIDPGPLWAPKLVMFSLATESAGHLTHIDNISLTDASGATLLHNGDFSEGLSRWFVSSDRHHMPWHAKNVIVHVLLDQGLIGLALLSLLYVSALLRITLGPARRHPLAPGIAGALVAFLVVGMFDSLLDVPRVGFVFYFLLLLGLTLRTTSNWPART